MAGVLLCVTIVAGYTAAPQVADPNSVPRPWSYLTDSVCALVTFGATSTLTTLAYCLVIFRDSEPVRKFLNWVAQNAGIGAVLGTLLGCRMALPLALTAKPATGQDVNFVGFMGIVSNTATMFTLFMIATCWWRVAALVTQIGRVGVEQGEGLFERVTYWARTKGLGIVAVLLSNYAGLSAAAGVWQMLQ
jgi:hypothetical protein